MSERSTPDGHDAEGNYDWRNDPLENTPVVRGYQPTKPTDVLHDLRQMSGIDHVGQTAIRAAEEIERLRALLDEVESHAIIPPGLRMKVILANPPKGPMLNVMLPTPPAQDATHGAQAQRAGDGEGEASQAAGGACGDV